MPEQTSVAAAHKLVEREEGSAFRVELIEVVEALVISLVVAVTAWCGYETARWEGRQAFLYGTSARLRVEAAVTAAQGGQQRLLDVVTFNTWIQARQAKNMQLAALYVRRFSPEFRVAFDAWIKTKPTINPNAPPGPSWMPEYHNSLIERGARLDKEATAAFTEGTDAREIADHYVANSLLLAMVLVLLAMAQRFKMRKVRIAVLLLAVVVAIYVFGTVATYHRL
jgi:hypothetical protein